MTDRRVVTPEDLGEGIEWNEQTKQYEPKLLFTDRVYTFDFPINGITLVFRQLKNADRPMVCTGIFSRGVWRGDGPSGRAIVDPFA